LLSLVTQYGAFLTENVPEYIKPDNWPPYSPDLNLVNFSIWGYLQQLVYRQKIYSIQHLKDVFIDCWSEISQQFFDSAIDHWSCRITAVVAACGRHIKYHLIRKYSKKLSPKQFGYAVKFTGYMVSLFVHKVLNVSSSCCY